MNLWNRLKGVLKRDRQPTQSAPKLFEQMCLENGVHPEWLRKANAIQLFEDWYDGPADRAQIISCFEKFKQANPSVQRRLGDVVLK